MDVTECSGTAGLFGALWALVKTDPRALCVELVLSVWCEGTGGTTWEGPSVAVHLAFGRLGQSAVLFYHHVMSELLQYRLDAVFFIPSGQRVHRLQVHKPS